MEEDDGNSDLKISKPILITASTNPSVKPINSDASAVPKISYSQPLVSGISYTNARRKGARNYSFDDEDGALASSASNSITDDVNGNNAGSNSRLYMHSSSLPEETLGRHRPPVHHQIDRALTSAMPATKAEHEVMTVAGANPASLPEFMGKGGGKGIFKVPVRGAVHMNRPPSLDLRPHPLRETQVGTFLRIIGCSESQVWAGQESGVRVWDLEKAFLRWDETESMIRLSKGDGESSPFLESRRTSPALCLFVDVGNRLVWSGHKDGKIRSWKMDLSQIKIASDSATDVHGDAAPARPSNSACNNANSGSASAAISNSEFMESLTWQAHPTPVLCMTFTSQGDLWSGSEGGVIKVWPWESLEKSLTLGERHMAALLVERSCVDLRSQVTVGGVCSLPSSDVRFLVSDHSRSKIWSGASVSFALWNSRTKELIRVFNIDGHVENKVDSSSGHDSHAEDEIKAKVVSATKREKNQLSFFQRSRNALMGAADVVRRVATKGTFGEDNRKTEAMIISTDGMIWTGCSSGAIVQWDGNANRLQEFQHQPSSVLSLCSFGTRIWVGYSNGSIQMIDLDGNLLGGWVAHSSPVIKIEVAGSYIFTLANHGGVRGWHLTSPGPLDDISRLHLVDKEQFFTKFENCKILVGTWNVGQERASHDSLSSWVGTASSEADIVIIGCQEVEMGAGFLAMAAAKETVGLEGSANGHWWLDAIGKTLDEGKVFDRIGSRQLAGLLIAVWAKKHIRNHIGDIDAGAVACGFGRAIGNKGGVGLRMRIYDQTLCLVNCHFAAHLEAVNKRNADFDHIFRTLSFSRPSIGPHSFGAGTSSSIQGVRGPNQGAALQFDDGSPELSDADLIIFLGDFNYRLHGISYDEARDFVSQRCFDWLREKDQLREEMKSGRVFQGMREGLIRFPPTYKFDRHKPGLSGYDSGEKKRIPAWCDRILYRDNRSISLQECSLECPVVSSILHYDACMDVTDSDHKPVRCLINVDIARSDKSVKRQNLGEILMSNIQIRSFILEICTVPEITVSSNSTVLQNMDTTVICITNRCKKNKAIIEISCEGQSSINKEDGSISEPHRRGGSGFPRWLEVVPTTDVIQPGQIMELSLRHEEGHALDEVVDGIPQNWTCEDTRDKEVILTVTVKGNYTAKGTSHRIHVRHFFISKNATNDSKTATIESKTTTSDSKNATSGSKNITGDSKNVNIEAKTAISGSKTVTSDSKNTTSDLKNTTNDSKNVTSGSKNATSGSKAVANSDSRASSRITQKPD